MDRSSSLGISSTDVGRGFSRDFLLVCVAGRASTSTRFGAPEAHTPPRPATLTVAVFLTMGGASARPPAAAVHSHAACCINDNLQCESKNPPPEIFCHFFPNGWEFLMQILHAYYTFLSALEYKVLLNYLQL